jgi:uncharacterized membrane protein
VGTVQTSGRVEVTVDADPESVWRVVGDVTRTGEWSHECRSVHWMGGASAAVPGARFRGTNRAGLWRWSRTSEIVTVEEGREIVWRTVPTALFPDSTRWCIEVHPAARGTRIIQSFEVVRAPRLLGQVYALLIPSHKSRDFRLEDDLERIGIVARRDGQ